MSDFMQLDQEVHRKIQYLATGSICRKVIGVFPGIIHTFPMFPTWAIFRRVAPKIAELDNVICSLTESSQSHLFVLHSSIDAQDGDQA